ncbi:hypothetical protein SPAN111604_00945 [Sphingomonas antarctica]|uniref:hypothetical protein n=1 Tax=Sphingomonas antarctica TaxID=2040274 RepID=UPI0039E8AEBC
MHRWRAVLALSLLAAAPPPVTTGFPDIQPVEPRDLARRMLGAAIAARIDRHEVVPPPLQVEAAKERFSVAVPGHMPPNGYGLLVYISPFDTPDLPPGWGATLDEFGMIGVSAANSGNRRGAFVRRAPLALMAARGVMQQYRIDPARVVIAGFSGGSRVALKLALAYPELFKGALLDAGTDLLGSADLPWPLPEQLAQARSMRFAILAGENDSAKIMNVRAGDALRAAGFTEIYRREIEHVEHDAAPAKDFRNALLFLDKRAKAAPPLVSKDRGTARPATRRLSRALPTG